MNAGKNNFPESGSLRKLKEKSVRISGENEKYRRSQRKAEEKEALSEQRRTAFHFDEDDRVAFGDCYSMTATVFSYPFYNILPAVFIGGMIYAAPPAFDFNGLVEQYLPWGWETLVALVVSIHLAAVFINVLGAVRLRLRLRRLPFGVTGLGILIHRIQGRNYFRRCTVALILDETTGIPAETIREVESMVLKLISHEAAKPGRSKVPGPWKMDKNTASGYASWRIAGRIVTALNDHLTPVHREFGIVRSVVITTPKGIPQSSDYFEWSPED